MSTPIPLTDSDKAAATGDSPTDFHIVSGTGDRTPAPSPVRKPVLDPKTAPASKEVDEDLKKRYDALLKAFDARGVELDAANKELKREQDISTAATDLTRVVKKDLDEEQHRHALTRQRLRIMEANGDLQKAREDLGIERLNHNQTRVMLQQFIANRDREIATRFQELKNDLWRKQNYRA